MGLVSGWWVGMTAPQTLPTIHPFSPHLAPAPWWTFLFLPFPLPLPTPPPETNRKLLHAHLTAALP